MPGGALAAGASLGSAYMGSKASKKASEAQERAAANALSMQKKLYDDAQAHLSPFIDTGKNALYSLAQLYGLQTPQGAGGEAFNEKALEAFRKSPDYAFRFAEGNRALQFSDAAKGLLKSRSHLNNTVDFGQRMAGVGFGDYAGRLMDLSKIGASTAGTAASVATGQGQVLGNTAMAQGQAQASGIVGSANAWMGGIQNVANNVPFGNMFKGTPSAYAGNFSNQMNNVFSGRGFAYGNNPWGSDQNPYG